MAEFRMPSLGADMDAGTLTRWLVRPGDRVRRGDIVATVETDKADIDVEVWISGTVGELLVREGERVPVGSPLAVIEEEGASAPAAPPAPVEPAPEPQPTAAAPPAPVEPTPEPQPAATAPPPPIAPRPSEPSGRPRVSPLARTTAERLDVDLGAVRGTGIGGAITREDVEQAAAGRAPVPDAALTRPPPSPSPAAPSSEAGGGERAAAIRRAIAAAMSLSHREIPHYYLARTVDLHRTLEWLEHTNRERPVQERLIPAALFVKAVATAAREVPEMNGHWLEDGFRHAERVNVGFGIHIPDAGLIAPAFLDVDRQPLSEVMRALRDLVGRARRGVLRASEMSEATITVTSLGERSGVDAVYGIINPPQVALVGFGAIQERPWAEQGLLGVRRQVTVTLAADHRASDGHSGARFLAAIARLLQEPHADE